MLSTFQHPSSLENASCHKHKGTDAQKIPKSGTKWQMSVTLGGGGGSFNISRNVAVSRNPSTETERRNGQCFRRDLNWKIEFDFFFLSLGNGKYLNGPHFHAFLCHFARKSNYKELPIMGERSEGCLGCHIYPNWEFGVSFWALLPSEFRALLHTSLNFSK